MFQSQVPIEIVDGGMRTRSGLGVTHLQLGDGRWLRLGARLKPAWFHIDKQGRRVVICHDATTGELVPVRSTQAVLLATGQRLTVAQCAVLGVRQPWHGARPSEMPSGGPS